MLNENRINETNKYALITEYGEKVTYSMLITLIDDLANYIKSKRLALLIMNNDIGAVVFYLVCLKVGTIPIILDKNVSKFEISQYINKYEPEYIFLPSKNFLVQDMIYNLNYIQIEKELFRHVLFENKETEKKNINPDLALLLPTSGTTDASKLVRISRENLYNNTKNICEALEIKPRDVAVTSLPLSYTYGLSVLNTHLFMQATILLTDKSVLQKSFWNLINKYHVSSFAGVPYTYELLEMNGHLERENCINVYTQAGGKLSLRLQKLWVQHCVEKNKKFLVMYGQTEATARISVLPMEHAKTKLGSVGKIIPEGSISIEKVKNIDKEGEIVYFGRNVCMGYCSCMEDLKLGDSNNGMLRTGDIGYLDEDGFLYITGRKKDFVKMYGRRINLNSISHMIEDLWGVKTYCTHKDGIIEITYEEKSRDKIIKIQHDLYRFLHIKQSDLSYFEINHFTRTYNGKIYLKEKD